MRLPKEVKGDRRQQRLEKKRHAMPVTGRGLLDIQRRSWAAANQTWLSLREAAAALGVTQQRLEVLISMGLVPARRDNGEWRLSNAELNAFRARGAGRGSRARR